MTKCTLSASCSAQIVLFLASIRSFSRLSGFALSLFSDTTTAFYVQLILSTLVLQSKNTHKYIDGTGLFCYKYEYTYEVTRNEADYILAYSLYKQNLLTCFQIIFINVHMASYIYLVYRNYFKRLRNRANGEESIMTPLN